MENCYLDFDMLPNNVGPSDPIYFRHEKHVYGKPSEYGKMHQLVTFHFPLYWERGGVGVNPVGATGINLETGEMATYAPLSQPSGITPPLGGIIFYETASPDVSNDAEIFSYREEGYGDAEAGEDDKPEAALIAPALSESQEQKMLSGNLVVSWVLSGTYSYWSLKAQNNKRVYGEKDNIRYRTLFLPISLMKGSFEADSFVNLRNDWAFGFAVGTTNSKKYKGLGSFGIIHKMKHDEVR